MHIQNHIKNLTFATTGLAYAAVGVDGDICTVISTDTVYKYVTLGSAYVVDGKSYLSTGLGGDTRWVGIAGKYTSNQYIVDQNNVNYRMNVTEIYPTLGKISESASYGGTILAIDIDDTHLYIGGGTTNKVRKILKTDLSTVADTASYGGTIYGINAQNSTYIYYVGSTTVKVYKNLKSDMSNVAMSASLTNSIYNMQMDATHIYVSNASGYVKKVLLSDLSLLATSADVNGTNLYGLALDTNYVYSGGSGKVFKYNKSDLSKVAESVSIGNIRQIIHDGTYLYVTGTTNARIYKIDPSTMATAGFVSLDNASYTLSYDSNYIYTTRVNGYCAKYRKDLSPVIDSATNYGGIINVSKPNNDSEVYIGGTTTNKIYKMTIRARQILNYFNKAVEA